MHAGHPPSWVNTVDHRCANHPPCVCFNNTQFNGDYVVGWLSRANHTSTVTKSLIGGCLLSESVTYCSSRLTTRCLWLAGNTSEIQFPSQQEPNHLYNSITEHNNRTFKRHPSVSSCNPIVHCNRIAALMPSSLLDTIHRDWCTESGHCPSSCACTINNKLSSNLISTRHSPWNPRSDR